MIYLFLADGFEEAEALVTIDILRRAKIEVETVSVEGKAVKGAHGIVVSADKTAQEIDLNNNFDGVILPGGMPGTLNLEKSSVVIEALKKADNENLIIAAICAAPMILGKMGLLKGKKAVCYPGFEEDMLGAHVQNASVVEDMNIVTGKGPGAVFDFAFKLCDMIKGNKKTSAKLKQEMQCDR